MSAAQHLTTPDSVKKNTRPMSVHIEDNRIDIFIDEAEQLNVKPRIGDALYIDLLNYIEEKIFDADFNYVFTINISEYYKILLNGGIYERKSKDVCGNKIIEKKIFKGLRKTLEYYVYAKLVKHQDNNVTRFGFVQKEEQYSSHTDLKVKLASEKDALSVADGYMAECIEYIESNSEKFNLYNLGKAKNRIRFTIIGD